MNNVTLTLNLTLDQAQAVLALLNPKVPTPQVESVPPVAPVEAPVDVPAEPAA